MQISAYDAAIHEIAAGGHEAAKEQLEALLAEPALKPEGGAGGVPGMRLTCGSGMATRAARVQRAGAAQPWRIALIITAHSWLNHIS